jgi:hypothetical protein
MSQIWSIGALKRCMALILHTPFSSPTSIAAYNLMQMGRVSWRKQRHGSQITLGNYFQATSKFGAMKVNNLHLRKGAWFQPPISFPIVVCSAWVKAETSPLVHHLPFNNCSSNPGA